MPSQRLSGTDWSSLIAAFADAPGLTLFDLPQHTGTRARYRVLSAWPRASDEQDTLATPPALDRWDSDDHWLPLRAGFLAYRDGESRSGMTGRDCSIPAFTLFEYDWLLRLDQDSGAVDLVTLDECPADRLTTIENRIADAGFRTSPVFRLRTSFQPTLSRTDYLERLKRVREYIFAGDTYQVNFAQCFQAEFSGHPLSAFNALHDASPSPCSAYLDLGAHQILSLSPERFLKVQDRQVETRPIKGTRRRGTDPDDDQAMIRALQSSSKDRAENLMIVDLLRNDLGQCCDIGTITAAPLFEIETFTNVHHLVSTVRGQLRSDLTPLDLLFSAFPGGSITGAPKRRAMQIIRELESHPRSAYCGSFFHWTPATGFDSTIAIRTLECQGGQISCWGGGGIVADSDPQEEYEESLTKIQLFMDVLEAL